MQHLIFITETGWLSDWQTRRIGLYRQQ